jgi:alkylation response protein AidB-like acyl-CoA dehydrogenase|tara:strand:- start:454 stop:1569 length:1116 start_codon:yes stop_codon:yes gene_type:complete
MNFEFSSEQNLLRDQAKSFLADKSPLRVARQVLDGATSYDAELWRSITSMGWTATTIPEKYHGLGLSQLELCVIAEELGRALSPVPFSSSVYMATEALLLAGSEAQKEALLGKLAQGEVIGCMALTEKAGPLDPNSVDCKVSAGKLTGTKVMVSDGDLADFAVVLARSGDDCSLFLVDLNGDGVKREVMATMDPSRSHARIDFTGADADPLGAAGDGFRLLEGVLDHAAVLYAFEQVGGAEATLDMAKEYALERYAFGRPIASYQALKHKMARMYVACVLARSNCYFGAWALSTRAAELPVAAATARVSATQAYKECAEENIQIHGGMGFTWEFDCHLYYRRHKLLAVNIGSESFWRDRLITRIEAQKAAA